MAYGLLSDISRRSYDPQCNRVLGTHVNRIIRRYKALPTPVTAEALRAFAAQVKADYEVRFPVRSLRLNPITSIAQSSLFQYIDSVKVWMNDQEEQRLIRLNDARRQRFEE